MGFIITLLASVLVFGTIIFIHELGHFIAAKKSGITVNEFSLGMGPKLFSKKKGETVYSLRAFPIGGFVAMEGEDEESDNPGSFGKAAVWKRIIVVIAGATMNLVLGFVVLLGLTMSYDLLGTRTVARFADNATSHATGLEAQDTIVAVNGRKTYLITDIQYELARVTDGTVDLTVQRDGKKVELEDVRFAVQQNEDGTSYIQLDFQFIGVEKTFGNVLTYAWRWTGSVVRLVFTSLIDLVTGNVAINRLSGPVGIVSVINEATHYGISSVLSLLALISINLGVFNVLPLPALDGGRLVFLLFEAVTKKKLNPKYEAAINIAGFVLLMLLMVFVTYNDISTLIKR